MLYEDEGFPARQQAALLASKVYYHLGELQEALTCALNAGDYFDVAGHSIFVQTIVGQF